ncbi:FxSxx-COOH system tetratricopeptide repeat protein [Catenulispora yoronensis]|uniref:FxSxx-COOH system tetratricopeptide repeat protein n=1 Tax=Catenulispora yoronensis TaxID=450799 RepID=UPI0031D2709F
MQVPFGLSNLPIAEVFIGRETELAELASAMGAGTQVVAQAVSGLGGIGKSSLAAAYARAHSAGYAGIWWLVADSRAGAEAGLADLARRLCPQAAGHPDPVALMQWAISWLAQHPGVLLIWDNVEDVEDVRELIAALPSAAHLVTSRRYVGWHRIRVSEPLRLGPLPADDAVDLLTRLASPALAGDSGQDLCSELGFLPLAVEQVGSYLAEAGMTAADYVAAWRAGKSMPGRAAEMSRPDRIMSGVWRATLDRLSDTPLAGRVLHVLAWLAPEGTPVRWLAEAFQDDGGVREALRRLNAFSMVSLSPGGTVGVHRVVQAVTRTRTPDAEDGHRLPDMIADAQRTAVQILVQQLPEGDYLEPEVAERWRIVMPHVDALAVSIAGRDAPAAVIGVMDRAYGFWLAHGNPAAAIAIAECSLAGEERHHGPDHLDTLASRSNLAGAYRSVGRVGEAVVLYEAVLAACERVLGADHPDTLSSRNNLAGAYRSVGRVGEAVVLYEAVLAACERVLGADHPDTLTSRNNLAGAYESVGRVGEAIELHEATLAACERVLGADHPNTLTSRNNLAYTYQSVGRVGEAVVLYEAALNVCELVLGTDHPTTRIVRGNLAATQAVVPEKK